MNTSSQLHITVTFSPRTQVPGNLL